MDSKRVLKISIVLSVISIENSKTSKMLYIPDKTLVFSNTYDNCSSNDEKIFKDINIY